MPNVVSTPQVSGASFSNFDFGITNTDNSNITATAQTAYAPVISASNGANVTYNGSDYGALSGALAIFEKAQEIVYAQSADSQITARQALQQAQKTVGEQGAGALALITKPFLWAAALVAAIIIFGFWTSRKKGA